MKTVKELKVSDFLKFMKDYPDFDRIKMRAFKKVANVEIDLSPEDILCYFEAEELEDE